MNRTRRAVLDTNVLISALVFRSGALASLRTAWQARRFTPIVGRVTVLELMRVLAYPKFRLTFAEQEILLAEYLPFCETVQIPQPPPTIPDCRDPSDVPFVQLAIVGQADYLVSGDRDLLMLEAVANCRILTPERFVALLEP